MPIVRIAEQAAGPWRPGQVVREVVGEAQGSTSLSMQHFEVEPGGLTPLHRHDVDEAILVLSGRLRVRIEDEWSLVGSGGRMPVSGGYAAWVRWGWRRGVRNHGGVSDSGGYHGGAYDVPGRGAAADVVLRRPLRVFAGSPLAQPIDKSLDTLPA